MEAKKTHKVTLIPGDWVGPEVTKVACEVIAAAGVKIEYEDFTGWIGPLTKEMLDSCRRTGVVLKAKLDPARHPGKLPPTIALRKELKTFATVRPVLALPGLDARQPGTDLVVIRETSEDIYSGFEHKVDDGVFEAVKVTTEKACTRIARYAFEYALHHGRKKVTVVHKSNIMKKADGLFLKAAQEVAKDYVVTGIVQDEVIVDALCMKLVKRATEFDVLLAGNLFGDIVSDLASGLAGGVSASPSASYGDGVAIFDTPHGKAPAIVGTGKANPIASIHAGALMLEHLGEQAAAARILEALEAAVEGGARPYDRGGTAGCREIRDAVIRRLA